MRYLCPDCVGDTEETDEEDTYRCEWCGTVFKILEGV